MPNYASAYDVMMCEPPDNSIEEARFDARREAAFDEYLKSGDLPGGADPSDVDEQMDEEITEGLDDLLRASDDEALLDIAKRLAKRRTEVIEQIIIDNLRKEEAEHE